LPGLFQANPLQFYKCFISFAVADVPFPSKLYKDLVKSGASCWKFDESAVLGRGLWTNIDRAIRSYDKVIVVCSERSLQSPAVLREIERALQKEDDLKRQQRNNPSVDVDVLFPVRLDDYVFSSWEHERKADVVVKTIGDFRRRDAASYKRGLQQLLTGLNPHAWLSKH
jgi:hypothetical protein